MREKYRREHPMDVLSRRCTFIKFRMNVGGFVPWVTPLNYVDGFEYSTYKNGKYTFIPNPVTELLTCGICGIKSTPKKIVYHSPFSWKQREEHGLEIFNDINQLCWSCLNKLKPLEKAMDELDEMQTETNRIKRKLNESTKNNARAS